MTWIGRGLVAPSARAHRLAGLPADPNQGQRAGIERRATKKGTGEELALPHPRWPVRAIPSAHFPIRLRLHGPRAAGRAPQPQGYIGHREVVEMAGIAPAAFTFRIDPSPAIEPCLYFVAGDPRWETQRSHLCRNGYACWADDDAPPPRTTLVRRLPRCIAAVLRSHSAPALDDRGS